jgi:hypothetical protein
MKDYARRYDAAMRELGATDIWKANYAPPLMLVQRRMGLKPRPPHYLNARQVIIGYGTCFAVVWGTSMWFISWAELGLPVTGAFIAAGFAGLFFGFAMAYAYRRTRRKWSLSDWDDL